NRDPAPAEGDVVTAEPEAVTIEQVIAAEGPRTPGFEVSTKAFRLGFIFLTRPGTEPSADELAAVDRIRRFFAGHFFALTRGVAVADTTLADVPPAPPPRPPDPDRARAAPPGHPPPRARGRGSAAARSPAPTRGRSAVAHAGP